MAVLVVLGVAAFLLLGGDVPGIGDGPSGPGEFSFDLRSAQAFPITDTPPADLRGTAEDAGTGIKETMDELYLRAFVDTSSWGDYGAAFAVFDDAAQARAEADVEVLTLGSTAEDEFRSVAAPEGTLTIAVQTDKKDAPVTAIARVRFRAEVGRKDGGTVEVSSVGSFFLRPVGGTWRIFAYRVDRDDQTTAAPTSSGSPS